MSQNVTKCHTFSNLWYKATFTFYVWIRLGTTLSCMLPKITSFGILKVDQNISNAIKDRWGVPSVARRCTTWRSRIYSRRTIVEHVHHMSVSGYLQLRGDQINMQRVGFLCPLFLALSTALVIVWAAWWSQNMMGRGLEWGAGCLLNLYPGQNAPLWCMQGTSTVSMSHIKHQHTYTYTHKHTHAHMHLKIFCSKIPFITNPSVGVGICIYTYTDFIGFLEFRV